PQQSDRWRAGTARSDGKAPGLIAQVGPKPVTAVLTIEHGCYRGMVDGFVALVVQQVLLADIGDVSRLGVFGEQVVERLVLRRPKILGNGLIPFLAIREDR